MDLLQLPAALRRTILSHHCIAKQLRRAIATEAAPTARNLPPPPPTWQPPSPAHLRLSPETLNDYRLTLPPNTSQLKYASTFFQSPPSPQILYSALKFHTFPPSPFPEVAFLGRSNVGKSSLLNALFGQTKIKPARVSSQPGRTRSINGFGVSGGLQWGRAPADGVEKNAAWKRFPRGGIVVVDCPGYGFGSREEWGKEIMKYLRQRKQLRRTFLLIDAEHGLKASDKSLLVDLTRMGVNFQIVMSKVDKVLRPDDKRQRPLDVERRLLNLQQKRSQLREELTTELRNGTAGLNDLLCCSAEKGLDSKHRKIGIDELRWAVLSACGMESDEQGQRKRQMMTDIDILDEEEPDR